MSNSFFNRVLDKTIAQFSECSTALVIGYMTLFVLLSSVPTVYMIAKIFSVEYTGFLLGLSIILPLMLTPITVSLLLRLTKHLKHFKDELANEVHECKKKDLLLFEQARFVLMGEMLANISHQWKQPLNTIGLAVVSAKASDLDRERVNSSFDIIEDNINYLANTIDDFMSFFDKRTYSEIKELTTIAEEVKSLSFATISVRGVNLDIRIDPQAENIKIASSISQVLLNLINNSKDAFSELQEDKKIVIRFSAVKGHLEISCYDNAGGIDSSIIDKIFDPYFTTKDKSLGTGIGLYMSKQIMQKVFNASIKVVSQEDKTIFNLTIPFSDACVE